MKKQNSLFAWLATTPPMLLLALFVLFSPAKGWADDVAIWGFKTDTYAFDDGAFPNADIEDKENGIAIISNISPYLVSSGTYAYRFTTGSYLNINLGADKEISKIETSILYDGSPASPDLCIRFCSVTPFNESYVIANSTVDLIGNDWANYCCSNNPTLNSVSSIPNNAKSAQIFSKVLNYGDYLYRLKVTAVDAEECEHPITVSYSKSGSETGSVPSNGDICTDNTTTITIPGKNTLIYDNKHVFVGWEKGGVTYAEGETYTITSADISAGSVEFTAVWREVGVSNLESSKEGNYTVNLSWTIDGICDLSKGTDPIYIPSNDYSEPYYGTLTSHLYNPSDDYITANGNSPIYGQYGIGFDIPATTNLSWLSYEWKGYYDPAYGISLCATACSSTQAYWNADSYPTSLSNDDNFTSSGPFSLTHSWWSTTLSTSPEVSQIVIFANAGAAANNVSFSVKNVRYGITGQADVDHVVIRRNVGSAPTTISEGTQIFSGTTSWFIDNDEKEPGTYYYSLFAVYSDESVSSPVVFEPIVIESVKADPELSISVDKSIISTSGTAQLTVNTANTYTGTLEYTISPAGVITLNESTGAISAVAAGTATITVTAPTTAAHYTDSKSVEVQVLAPPTTNLALDASGDDVELSWNIPGIIDLRTAKTTPSIDSYGNCTSKEVSINNNNEELKVTYSANTGWTDNAFSFDVNISNIESLSFEYHGDYTGGVWSGIYPVLYCQSNTSAYWDAGKGTHGLSVTEWTSKEASTFTPRSGSAFDASNSISELLFVASDEGVVSCGHMWVRNVRYHTTGMVDIDHIVIMRTTGAAATDTVSGTKLYSGRLFHYTDNASLSSGIYYYTIFAVYEDGCFPVESVTLDTRSFSIIYKDKGDAEFSGTHETGYPTTHSNAAATALKKATKEDYIFVGWYNNEACTGDAVTSLAAGAYDADITLYARWEQLSLHQPGKYQAPDGYGRVLKNVNGHDYEVYMVTFDTVETEHYGTLYAGPVAKISDGYRMFRTSSNINITSTSLGDGWVEFKPYKYGGGDGSGSIDEFKKLDGSGNIHSARYARLSSAHYVRLYVQGYVEFALCCKDKKTDGTDNIVIRIDGVTQAYAPNTSMQVVRYTLTSSEPHFIEITGNSSESKEDNVYGFSLQLPDVERYTVTVAKNDNSYGTVSAASIANVRRGEATYISDNTVYIAGTTIEATPTESNAQYTYAFNNWTVGGAAVPATITAATTITANFTRTAEEYTLTWDLDGGTVTTAGTGAAVDATGTPSTTVAFGEAITAPEVAKDGCRFLGWDVTPAATMPAEHTTYTAQWAAPIVIGSGTTIMDYLNVYKPTAPAEYQFDVDGVEGNETCLDIKDQGQADWWVKMTPASYRVVVKYGTPSGCVKVKVQIIDAETDALIKETALDEHCSGTVFMAAWAMDLSELIDANKTYYIRVKDAYESTGSKPKVGSVEVTPIEPETITNSATKRLDYDNVAVPYQILPFDIEDNGSNENCLFIGNEHQADWKATITPDVYNIHVTYGKPSASTNLTLYLLDKDENAVWTSDARTTPSGRYETWEIKGVDLTGLVDKDEEYTIRIKDTYGSQGSKPYIGYIDFIPAVVKIPAVTRLDATNTYSSVNIRTDVNFDDDALTSDESMKLDGTQADYVVQIQPGYYNVSLAYGAPEYSVRVAVTLTDPTGAEEERYLSTNPYYYESGSEGVEHHHISSMKCDLTGLDGNKSYRLHIKDMYGSSNNLRVSHLQFSPIEPVLIANNTILNSTNTVTFNAPTQGFNVDGVEGNETCLLVSQHYGVSPVEWSVNVTPGVYDLNVHFGNNAASDGGYDMTIYLVDPEAPESPVSLYHKRVSDGTSLSYGVARCDFSGLVADKDYIIRVVDNWDGSKLRVGDIKFVTPAPLQIPDVTRLNASNVYVTPHYGKQNFNIEGEGEIECLNIRYQGEAAWFANMTPYVYNITVKYGKASAGSKVRFGIIKVSTGDTIFVQQDDKGAVTEPTTYTAQANLVDLRSSITAGDLCKIFVKDNYPSLGSEPRVAYIDIARATINHTRTGLRVGDFGTVCLPYDIAAEDIQGAEIYKLVEWPVGACAVTLDQVASMEAGHPYIYQATASEATWRYYPEGDPTAAASVNGLRGSYDRVVITPNDNNYIIYNNKLYYVDNLAYVGINKAYINRTEAEAASAPLTPAPGMRRIYMAVHGEQVVTGLDQITNDQSLMTIKIIKDNQLYIIREGKTYNAQGQLVNK